MHGTRSVAGGDLGPWSRLIEAHRDNARRLDATAPPPPPWWGLPLGVALPMALFGAAALWQTRTVVSSAALCFAALVPVGLVCLFIGRLQTFSVGLVLGALGALLTAVVLFG